MAEALKTGRKILLGSVDATAKGAETSMKVLEAYGMTISKVVEPMIFYAKVISEQEVDNG